MTGPLRPVPCNLIYRSYQTSFPVHAISFRASTEIRIPFYRDQPWFVPTVDKTGMSYAPFFGEEDAKDISCAWLWILRCQVSRSRP